MLESRTAEHFEDQRETVKYAMEEARVILEVVEEGASASKPPLRYQRKQITSKEQLQMGAG